MLLERDEQRVARLAQVRGPAALLLGLSISLDELAIGFTLGLLRLPAGLVIALIALQAFVVAQLGLRLGSRLSERLREAAERVAGLALAGLGAALLVEKLLS
jgi:putative Mn2+ efflux pump MntP